MIRGKPNKLKTVNIFTNLKRASERTKKNGTQGRITAERREAQVDKNFIRVREKKNFFWSSQHKVERKTKWQANAWKFQLERRRRRKSGRLEVMIKKIIKMVRLKEEKVNQVKPKFFLFCVRRTLDSLLSGRVLKFVVFVNKFVTNSAASARAEPLLEADLPLSLLKIKMRAGDCCSEERVWAEKKWDRF